MKPLIFFLSILATAFIPTNESYNFDNTIRKESVTINNANSANLASNKQITVRNKAKTSFECIAAGGCKYKVASSCYIVFCDGGTEEDNTNATVDLDKIIIINKK